MAATGAEITVYEADTGSTQIANSPHTYKEIIVFVAETADDTDTVAVTLATYGITTLKYVRGFKHTHSATTEGPIIILEAPTTSVTTGVLTITVGGSTDNCARVYLVGGI